MEIINKNIGKKESTKQVVYSIFIVTIASALLAMSIAMFITPTGFYAVGVTGIAQIILRTTSLIIEGNITSFDKYLAILNFLLLLPFDAFAYFKLSKKYGLYSLLSSVVQTIVLEFSDFFIGLGLLRINGEYNLFACAFAAGMFGGVCNAMLYKRGATSGGITILAQYMNFKKNKSVGYLNFIISFIILTLGAIITFFSIRESQEAISNALTIAFYTLVTFLVSSIVLDYSHTAYNKIKLEVVTEKGEEVIKKLMDNTPHGVTIQKAIGGYTMREKTVLFIIIQNYEQMKYLKLIKGVDEHAFVTTTPVTMFSGNFKLQIIDK